VIRGSIVLKKAPKKLNLSKWKGRCGDTFAKLGYTSVDKFIDDVSGRYYGIDTNVLLRSCGERGFLRGINRGALGSGGTGLSCNQ
jgi:hypothetical protein